MTPTFHLLAAVTSMAGGVAISAVALHAAVSFWLLLLPVGWVVTLHGMRNLRMMVFHQCAHRNMWARTRTDRVVGRLVAGLLVVQGFEQYSREHVADHHAVHHMTLRDPTVQAFLVSLELRPGMPRATMWRIVTRKLLSPRFHLSFAVARVRSYAGNASRTTRVVTAVCYALLAAGSIASGLWPLLLLGWCVPLTVLFQISNTLRLCVKHTFPSADTTERRGKAYFASLTNAIFLGEAAPAPALPPVRRLLAWTRWALRMGLVHFPARYLVLTGDTVVHDFHHRHPMSRQWADYVFARQRDIESGHPGWPDYQEAWGLAAAVNRVFDSLSAADPAEFDPERLPEVSKRELFAAFDD
ncbi:fatty acid desaturase [Streptomyces sp.]|uniref:fatty acid desaturase n=1 Tax=Streptomyces sp. TaxID=1931 RepID=UPI002F414833